MLFQEFADTTSHVARNTSCDTSGPRASRHGGVVDGAVVAAHASGLYDPACDGRYCEISDNADYHK